ncbi:MAG: hypothetical protein FJ290_13755 [Planctomycetes bacterium]|nr:hypothetical protein [Planctomycetota bacterium]
MKALPPAVEPPVTPPFFSIGTSRLAIVALVLACLSFPIAHVPFPLAVSCPLVALACAALAMGRIRRSRGRLDGAWAARLALLLTMFEILFVSMAFELPGESLGTVVNIALGILLVSLYVYALWPARGEDAVEFRVVTRWQEGHDGQGTVGIDGCSIPGVNAGHHLGQGQPPEA